VISISLEGNLNALWGIIDRLQRLPQRRFAAISRIMRDGVVHNHEVLSMGGSVPDADGFNISWSRQRSRMTIAIRQRHGLGALFPILSLTGKLERGLAGGNIASGATSATYSPRSDVFALIRVHQLGLAPLPSRSGQRANFTMPPRKIIFWSSQMAKQVRTLAEAEVRGGAT